MSVIGKQRLHELQAEEAGLHEHYEERKSELSEESKHSPRHHLV